MAASTPSLQELSSSVIASNLGKLAGSVECLFFCGGTIPQVENVVLFYMEKCGDWSSEPLKLPAEFIDVRVFLLLLLLTLVAKLSLIRNIVML